MAGELPAEADATAKTTEPDATQIKWIAVIEQYDKAFKDWHKRGMKLWNIYSEERRAKTESADPTSRRMSLFYSNVSTLQPAIYAKMPHPNVSRRFKDEDPIARAVAEISERCLISLADESDFDAMMRSVRDDFLITARGAAWVRYEADTEALEDAEGNSLNERGEPLGEDESPAEQITGERVIWDFVNWQDFGHTVARTWGEVTAVWRKAYMTRRDGVKRFGKEKFAKVELDQVVGDPSAQQMEDTKEASKNKATVYEIWDKTTNKVYFIAKGANEPLEIVEPYLNLKGFFPCPKPAYGPLTTNSLIPTPEYVYYQDQIEEIDDLTARIAALQDALKLVGFYPAGPKGEANPEIETAVQAGFENRMIAIPNWAQFVDGGKGGAPIVYLPIEQVMKTIEGCIALRKQLIDDVYQITGISDIMRGEGDKDETATAQNIKSQWGSVRIRDRQNELAKFARECYRIGAEIIADKFQPETLLKMANMSLPTEAELQQQALLQQQQALMAQAQQAQQQPPQGQPMQPGMAA